MKRIYCFLTVVSATLATAQIVDIPDPNFKAKLTQQSSFVAQNLQGDYFAVDANADGQIQISEAQNVSQLHLNGYGWGTGYITDFTGINAFANLTTLNVQYQHMETLSISGLPFLNSLDCRNGITYLNTLILTNLPSLETLKCAQSQELSNVVLSNLPNLKYLSFGGCNFPASAFNDLPGIVKLDGYAGIDWSVGSIDLSNKPNLKTIDLENNQLTNIIFDEITAIDSLQLSGNKLMSFEKSHFPQLKRLAIGWNKLQSLDVSGLTELEWLDCDNNGDVFTDLYLTNLNLQGCSSLKTLICTYNVLSVLDCSGLTALEVLDCSGNYDIFTQTGLTAVNLENCANLQRFRGSGNDGIVEYDLSCTQNLVELRAHQCENLRRINLKNGHLDALTSGTFSRYSSPLLNLVGVDEGEQFSFLENPIAQSPYYNFTPNCTYNTLSGHVRLDLEGDGFLDDDGISGVKIVFPCDFGNCFSFSGEDGLYRIYTRAPSLSVTPEAEGFPLFDFGLSEPVLIEFDETGHVTYDFCLSPSGVHNDLEVVLIPLSVARPGFDTSYEVVVSNNGNQIQSGTITVTFPGNVTDIVSTQPGADAQTADTVSWNFNNLAPFKDMTFGFTLNINAPTDVPPVNGGDALDFEAALIIPVTDEHPQDNLAVLSQLVVNSFDPNDKTCLEGATVGIEKVGEYIHYLIRFENTGTFSAENIVVKDMIDTAKFDVSTLVPLTGSHPFETRISQGNKVEFIFENIMLPFDDASNDGYVGFKIKTRPNLVSGNTFSNTASIYFDHNFPIVTNTASTTIVALANRDFEFSDYFALWPNPVKNILHIEALQLVEVQAVTIYSVIGQQLMAIANPATPDAIDVSALQTGAYIVRLQTARGTTSTRFIKE